MWKEHLLAKITRSHQREPGPYIPKTHNKSLNNTPVDNLLVTSGGDGGK